MSAANIFQLHLVSGYVVWALCFGVYVVPWLRSMERAAAFLKDSPLPELCRALMNLNEFVYLD